MFTALVNQLSRFGATCLPGGAVSFLKFPTWYTYLDGEIVAGKCAPIVNFSDPGSLGKIALAVVEILLRVGGLVALGFVIYGGFRYMLSQGDMASPNVPKTVVARHTIVNALIGMVIAASATFVVQLIASNLSSK